MSPPGREYKQRAAVLSALYAGRGPYEVAKLLKVPKSTAYDIKNRYQHQGQAGVHQGDGDHASRDMPSPARKCRVDPHNKKRSKQFITKVKKLVAENPRESIRAKAKKLKVSERTLRRTLQADLRLKSYAIRVKQLLTQEMKEKRVTIGGRLLNSLKHDSRGKIRIFSDEKMFTTDWKPNRRNDRYICASIADVPVAMKSKHPDSVMVLGAVSSEGHVMPPHFFEPGEMITADVYVGALEEKVKPWIEEVTGGKDYVFQQDSAPAHTAKKTQAWCQENLRDVWTRDLWPPNSPDLNPMDFYLWGVVESKVNRHALANRDALKRKIERVMAKMCKEEVARACARFRPRLESVVQGGGGYIE